MPTVVGVKLRFAPKTIFFDPTGFETAQGDHVIVETERGTEYGVIVDEVHELAASQLQSPLKPIVRVASEEDLSKAKEYEQLEAEAMPIFRELVNEHKLDMKPVDVEYLFDGGKVVFYFTADDRVDFRELVRDLAARFKARIDMRQVGVRDEARMVGGIGHCGQVLCCTRFPGDFHPVSIRMAKEQDLPLNPLKISGLCGRLMCCLRYEYEAYKDFKGRAPKRKAIIETPLGLGKVKDFNTPRETVTLKLENGDTLVVPVAKMTCCKDKGCPCSVSTEALAEIQAAEQAASPLATSSVPELTSTTGSKAAKSSQASDSQNPSGRTRSGRGRSASSGQKSGASKKSKQGSASGSGDKAPGGEKGGDTPASDGSKKSSGRRRSRRSRSGKGSGSGGSSKSTSGAPDKSAPRQAAPKQQSGGEGGTSATQPPARRRRRRRRPPEGGQSTENG
ncbi:MAG: stage 0 sporulation family protein [Actinomycetota bacterium]|jgi:cell fate regulator YaaT (PSP1 superfamily)|nr:stage 0 sporulation family protein [Actinomycetota bacterium]